MKISGIKCKNCNATIYSRARHDYHYCLCGAVAVDGGRDYMKIIGDMETFEIVSIQLHEDITNEVLFRDWDEQTNKYGTINRKKNEDDYSSF